MYDNETDIIPIIARYLHREASDLEKQILLRWLEESDENRRFFSDLAANDAIHRTLTDGTERGHDPPSPGADGRR